MMIIWFHIINTFSGRKETRGIFSNHNIKSYVVNQINISLSLVINHHYLIQLSISVSSWTRKWVWLVTQCHTDCGPAGGGRPVTPAVIAHWYWHTTTNNRYRYALIRYQKRYWGLKVKKSSIYVLVSRYDTWCTTPYPSPSPVPTPLQEIRRCQKKIIYTQKVEIFY